MAMPLKAAISLSLTYCSSLIITDIQGLSLADGGSAVVFRLVTNVISFLNVETVPYFYG